MTALVILLITIAVLLVSALVMLRRLVLDVRANTHETRQLRLTSRTRVRTVNVKTGADTEEKVQLRQMRRLGRASAGKRIVYGGDPDSPQHSMLGKSLGRENPPHE